uniref:RING-type domain-containing protein n=1 Tax=Panagrellus redivivus TaxID=6233 RepID=A0A7E4WCU1_PANRE
MDWVHCNNCSKKPSANIAFFVSACGHVVCSKCISKTAESPSPPISNEKCRVCHVDTVLLEINRSLRPDVQVLFQNPRTLAVKYMNTLKGVMDFQEKQRARLHKLESEQLQKTVKCAREMNTMLKKKTANEKQLSTENKDLKERLDAMERDMANMARDVAKKNDEIEKLRRNAAASSKTPGSHPQKKYPSLNGDTPMQPLSFRDVSHSTPMDMFMNRRKTLNTHESAPAHDNLFSLNDSILSADGIAFGACSTAMATPDILGISKRPTARHSSEFTPNF